MRLSGLRGAVAVGFALVCVGASAQKVSIHQSRPIIELMFVLDTTGSMGGLIDGAKQRIWGIVNEVMRTREKPRVRVGLVAYRDNGDEYVTKITPLTEDLDAVYMTLMDFKAEGGGDTPENVRRALSDGLTKAGWAPRAPRTAQIIFLVGDAPPQEYQNEPDVLATAATAVRAGKTVNAIQCGSIEGTQPIWRAIAARGEGQYFAIAQDGGVTAIPTPYDKELGVLGERIGTTHLAYTDAASLKSVGPSAAAAGRADSEVRQRAIEEKVATAAPASASADRAYNKAINAYAYSSDLVQDIAAGKVRLDSLKKEQLPTHMQKMTKAQRQKEISKRLAERKALQTKILTLSKKRDAYIAAERKRLASKDKKQGFDAAVLDAMRKQAAKRSIKL